MSEKKSGQGKRRARTDTARKIWLAGIGAYGRAFSEAQDAIKEMTQDGSRVFEDLVQKGETIEASVQEKTHELVEKTKASRDEMTEGIDERIKEMRARLKRGTAPDDDDDSDIEKRLSAVEAKLDRLIKAMEKPVAKKPGAKKPSVKKTAAKKPAPKKSTKK